MARIRIILEDDHDHEINGNKERLYDLSGGTKRLVDKGVVKTLFCHDAPTR